MDARVHQNACVGNSLVHYTSLHSAVSPGVCTFSRSLKSTFKVGNKTLAKGAPIPHDNFVIECRTSVYFAKKLRRSRTGTSRKEER